MGIKIKLITGLFFLLVFSAGVLPVFSDDNIVRVGLTDNKFQKISHWSWQRGYSIRLMTKKDFSITILSIRVGMIVKEKSFTYKSRLKQIW